MVKDTRFCSRPTFKNTLRRISLISVIVAMIASWILISLTSMVALKQYAQTNLALLSSTISHSLEAATVFHDSQAALNTLQTLGEQGQFSAAIVYDTQQQEMTRWNSPKIRHQTMIESLVSKWVYPEPVYKTIEHNGQVVGTLVLTGTDGIVTHFVWLSLAVLGGCLFLAALLSLLISNYLHRDLNKALHAMTSVVHDVRENRDFSRRATPTHIDEFYHFAKDFNSLLDDMETWQIQLQQRNASLLKSTLHDPLTGLGNRNAFRQALDKLYSAPEARTGAVLLYMDGNHFKTINDTWGHNAGDLVLIETAHRLATFAGETCPAFRLGGDEFAILLVGIQHEADITQKISEITQRLSSSIAISPEKSVVMSLSIGYAWAHTCSTPEELIDSADTSMYQVKRSTRR